MKVLVTGGAGFIGSHLVDALVERGHDVLVLDSLNPQVHGQGAPSYLNPDARYVWGDLRDLAALKTATREVEIIYHLASLIDVEESMRQMARYVDVNVRGTATLLDALAKDGDTLERLILASSVAVYGEGSYRCHQCGNVEPEPRPTAQLEGGQWEVHCPVCEKVLEPQATPEEKTPTPISTYGLTKLTQERLFDAFSRTYGVPAIVLRYANVYGPRQRPGPYAGVCTTFLERAQKGEGPVVHEDGLQTRDFVSVEDVVEANLLAMEAKAEGTLIANVGTGLPATVLELWQLIAQVTGSDLEPVMEGTFRHGDIRHLWVDTRKAEDTLGFTCSIGIEEGLTATLKALL